MSKNHVARFPSLVVRAQELEPIGEFALTQATYLRPNVEDVAHLDALLRKHQIGVVAHFYMDPELQGVLAGCSHPHIHVSDSLVMADRAVGMAKAGARAVVVLGVDFMSEGVRAMLDAAGFAHVPVYRLATEAIGCSLAEAADSKEYGAFLALAARRPRSLHVTYINTSLRLKAKADALVPTITCTSSNVVRTVLTAFAQMPEAHVWFGPDTYMGRNLQMLFESLLFMPEEEIRRLHPSHTQQTVHDFLPRFHVFDRGNCVVHNLFGGSVVEKVRTHYQEAFVAAHLEVPGEMFQLAMERAQTGRGVVGSTSQILEFIRCTVRRNLDCPQDDRLTFVLGTEAGMITSIVRETQKLLQGATERLEVEIVFP
ncbi:MAG: quinolinate synthase NadA, partial [Myxococcota bacterium]